LKGYVIRIVVVILVFALAIIGMGIAFSSKSETVVKEKVESSFPVIFVRNEGEDLYNVMHGYSGEINTATISKGISIIVADKTIKLNIEDKLDSITNLEYSLYDLVMGIEVGGKNITSDIKRGNNGIKQIEIVFDDSVPFSEGKQYELRIIAKTGSKSATYYTDVLYSSNNKAESHMKFAMDFSNKSFDSSFAEELSWYLETKKGYTWDNDFSKTTIYDPIAAVMWENLSVEKIYSPLPVIKQVSDNITVVELKYLVKMLDKKYQYYNVTESYYLSTYNDVIYMNGYERTLDPQFTLGDIEVDNNRINLGIDDGEDFEGVYSNNGRFFAFAVSSQAWLYDLEKDTIVSLYNQEFDEENYYRSDYNNFGTTIIRVSDEGKVSYAIYGHINSGYYEGNNGILVKEYTYEANENNTVMFIPITDSYECIKLNGLKERYITSKGLLYLRYADALYSIDIDGKNSAVVVDGITDKSAYFSKTRNRFAWQENVDTRENKRISILDFETGIVQEIISAEDERINLVGYIKDDIVLGFIKASDILINLNQTINLPIRLLEIRDSKNLSLLKYEKMNECILNPVISENRISFEKIQVQFKQGSVISYSRNSINKIGSDFILHSQVDEKQNLISTERNNKGSLISYYSIKSKDALSSSIKKLIANEGESIEGVISINIKNNRDEEYYVYSLGKLFSVQDSLAEAIKVAKENNGWVLTRHGLIAWKNKKISEAVDILSGYTAISQYPELTLGCEVTALSTILNYEGFDIDKVRLASELFYEPQKLVSLADREFYGDMNDGYVGEISGSGQRGHGVYHEPIKQLMSQYIARHRVLDLTGSTLDELLYYVDKGIPVWTIVTVTYNAASDGNKLQWMTKRGMLEYSLEEHAVVIIGYNSTEVILADSITGSIIRKDRIKFEASIASFGYQALAYVK
jgi:uncharacterized protein YvpB